MIIRKAHIGVFEPFTLNVTDRLLDPHILNAENLQVKTFIGDSLYNAVRVISDTNPLEWSDATAYTTEMYAYSLTGGIASVYKCIQGNTDQPLTDTDYWEPSPLGNFWYNYLIPWAVFETLKIFIVGHGVHVTPSGVQINSDPTFLPIDGQTRSGLEAKYRNFSQAYRAKAKNHLDDVEWTISGTKYEVECDDYKPTQTNFILRGAGKKCRKR